MSQILESYYTNKKFSFCSLVSNKNNYLIPLSLEHGGVNFLHFKPNLVDLTEFIV